MQWYWSPDHLGFDILDNDDVNEAFVDDKDLTTFNADIATDSLMSQLIEMKKIYKTNHLMVPIGGDFNYGNAHQNYKSTDRLIRYMNQKFSNVTLLYSTPGRYIDALYQLNTTWPVRYEDLMPYGDGPNDYWTGYFTSRPNSKRQVRVG